MSSVLWTAYRSIEADQQFDNDKMTSGGLEETLPEPKYQSGGGNLTPETFGYLPKSQREAAMHKGMKGMETGRMDDVNSLQEGKTGDEQAKDMMDTNPPVGTERYTGESTDKDY